MKSKPAKTVTPGDVRIFEVRDRVRWSDVDIAGIIYFGAYVRFIELAETELMRDLGFPYAQVFDTFNMWLPRVHLDFDFFKPAFMDDELVMKTHVARVGTSSITLKTEVYNVRAAEMDAAATLVVVCVDRQTMKSRPLPSSFGGAFRACAAA
ncbi:MAG: acyl-CoA thioesterase [Candidatus Eremiobacteraeota bacterium]|nr:acyl-CoA thioesterase [Candidatus Eremiobacteraeota bacterium]